MLYMVLLLTFSYRELFVLHLVTRVTSEHLTPKDVVITSGPAQANLAMFLKGQQLCNYSVTTIVTAWAMKTSKYVACEPGGQSFPNT